MSEPITEPSSETAASPVFDLVGKYSSADDELLIVLSKGDVLKFKNVTKWSELRRIHEAAVQFALGFDAGPANFEGFSQFKGADLATLQTAYILAELSLDYSQLDFLTIADKAGALFNEIKNKLDLASAGYSASATVEVVERAKKNSEAHPSTGQS